MKKHKKKPRKPAAIVIGRPSERGGLLRGLGSMDAPAPTAYGAVVDSFAARLTKHLPANSAG